MRESGGMLQNHLLHLGQPPISHWEEMKMKLREKYLSIDYEDALYEKLIVLC